MGVDAGIESFIALTFFKLVEEAAGAIPVRWQGVADHSDTDDEEWLAPFVLNIVRSPSRGGTWRGTASAQVNCWSRSADRRSDGDTNRPWALASLIRDAIEKRFVPVQSYGRTPVGVVGYMDLGEASMVYLEEEDETTGIHGVSVSFRASMFAD